MGDLGATGGGAVGFGGDLVVVVIGKRNLELGLGFKVPWFTSAGVPLLSTLSTVGDGVLAVGIFGRVDEVG
jgi:hypothetical protein